MQPARAAREQDRARCLRVLIAICAMLYALAAKTCLGMVLLTASAACNREFTIANYPLLQLP